MIQKALDLLRTLGWLLLKFVFDLIDSLYKGYPTGYIILWIVLQRMEYLKIFIVEY